MLDGKRGAWVGAGHHAEEHRDIGNRATHGAFYTQSMEKQFTAEARHAAVGSAKTKNIVEARWIAQRAHHVAAVSHRQHAQGQGNSGATATASGALRLIIGIQRRAKHGIVRLRAETHFGDVGFADENDARAAKALDKDLVVIRN